MTNLILLVCLVAGMATGVASITAKPATGLRFRAHLQGGTGSGVSCVAERTAWNKYYDTIEKFIAAAGAAKGGSPEENWPALAKKHAEGPNGGVPKKLWDCCSTKDGSTLGLGGTSRWGECNTGPSAGNGGCHKLPAPGCNDNDSTGGGHGKGQVLDSKGNGHSNFKEVLSKKCKDKLYMKVGWAIKGCG